MNEETPQKAIDFYGGELQRLAADTWFRKYAMRDGNDEPLETHPLESRKRWLDAIGAVRDSALHTSLTQGLLVPGGRIQYGLGNPHQAATLKNCYVLPIKEDSVEGIFEAAKEMAKTYSRGGGVGTCISVLRPNRSKVRNCAAHSSGSVSFLSLYSVTTGTMGQHARRGALMAQQHVEHPDILEFLDAKADVNEDWLRAAAGHSQEFLDWMEANRSIRYANLSVQLSDRFMEAVRDNKGIELRFDVETGETISKTHKAREIWNRLIHRAWKSAEPGLVFWDLMKRESPSDYYDSHYHIRATNPCGEVPLEAYGACCLASLNLSLVVRSAFKPSASINWSKLKAAVRAGIIFLDGIVSKELEEKRAPLPAMDAVARDLRRIGLGVLGLAEMFIRLGVVYGSEQSVALTEDLFRTICHTAYETSVELAAEKGPFPVYDWQRHKNVPIIGRLDERLQERIATSGLRNVCLLSIAPTGTISLTAQTSGGLEPYFTFSGSRRVFNKQRQPTTYHVHERIVYEWAEAAGLELDEDGLLPKDVELPEYFVSAHDVDWRQRVRLQAAAQRWIDNSISSTVNLPADATPADIGEIYMTAWEAGCKGITVYRQGSRVPVLEPKKNDKPTTYRLPEVMRARRFSLRDSSGHRILITMGFDDERPAEVVISHSKTDADLNSLSMALGIMVSKALQYGMPVETVSRALRGIQASWTYRISTDLETTRRALVKSVPDAIALLLMRYQEGLDSQELVEIPGAEICPECKKRAYVSDGGCTGCKACGVSRCED